MSLVICKTLYVALMGNFDKVYSQITLKQILKAVVFRIVALL